MKIQEIIFWIIGILIVILAVNARSFESLTTCQDVQKTLIASRAQGLTDIMTESEATRVNLLCGFNK